MVAPVLTLRTDADLSSFLSGLVADLAAIATSPARQRDRQAAVERLIAEYNLPLNIEVRPAPVLRIVSGGPGGGDTTVSPP